MGLAAKIITFTKDMRKALVGPLSEGLSDPLSSQVYSFKDRDGRFDYESYRTAQMDGNKAKIVRDFADADTLKFVADYLKRANRQLEFGICHGTRRGLEQQWLAEFTGANVIGTEISDTADQFPNTIQWDFHDRREEWVGHFDFVYSNSHDHSYDPEKSISAWVEQLRPGGCVILEHTDAHHKAGSRAMDPWGVRAEVIPFLVARWGKGRFAVTEVLEPASAKPDGSKVFLLVIRPILAA